MGLIRLVLRCGPDFEKVWVLNEWKILKLQVDFSEDGANTTSVQLEEEEAVHDEGATSISAEGLQE